MGSYVAHLQIGNDSSNQMAFGDVLFGTCSSQVADTTALKDITITDLDRLINGIQIRVRFANGNTVSSGVQLRINGGSTISTYAVAGDCTCGANDVVTFTWEQGTTDATSYWRVTGNTLTKTIKDYVASVASGSLSGIDCMTFKGTMGTTGTIANIPTGDASATPTSQAYKAGDTYKIITAGTYAGQVCEVGDLIIAIADSSQGQTTANSNHWTVVQTNLDGAVTGPTPVSGETLNNKVAVFDGETGRIIKNSGYTIETSVPSGAVFTDTNTSYKYTISAPTTNVYNGTTTFNSTNAASTVLVSASNGVLFLEEGITFTTTAAVTSASLTESSDVGPILSSGT